MDLKCILCIADGASVGLEEEEIPFEVIENATPAVTIIRGHALCRKHIYTYYEMYQEQVLRG